MELLDSIESNYKREPAKVKLYDNKIVDASVYTISEEKRSVNGLIILQVKDILISWLEEHFIMESNNHMSIGFFL